MIEQILINALAIVGLYSVSREGFLLYSLKLIIEKTPMLKKLEKPLINCALCMSSIWGATYYIYSGNRYVDLVAHILAVAGSIYIISKVTSLLAQATTYLDISKLLKDEDDNNN